MRHLGLAFGATTVAAFVFLNGCSKATVSDGIPSDNKDNVIDFKKKAGRDRQREWEAISSSFAAQLQKAEKNKKSISRLCQNWLGKPDAKALNEARDAVASPLKPQPINGDVFAYPLSVSNGFSTTLIVDFREVTAPQVRILNSYDPPKTRDAHDLISADEKRIAKSLGAMSINLGGGSLDGRFKSGFAITLTGDQIVPETMGKLARLSTLVSLTLSGKQLDDRLLKNVSSHPYLADLTLHGTAISEAGFTSLSNARTLKFLTVKGSTISAAHVKRLQDSLPHLEVEIGADTFPALK